MTLTHAKQPFTNVPQSEKMTRSSSYCSLLCLRALCQSVCCWTRVCCCAGTQATSDCGHVGCIQLPHILPENTRQQNDQKQQTWLLLVLSCQSSILVLWHFSSFQPFLRNSLLTAVIYNIYKISPPTVEDSDTMREQAECVQVGGAYYRATTSKEFLLFLLFSSEHLIYWFSTG